MGSAERKLQLLIARIMQECEANREIVLKFLGFLEARGYSAEYRRGYVQTLYRFDRFIGGKSFHDATEDDVMNFLKGLKPVSRATYGARLKSFYRWLFNGTWRKGPYPKIVENIPTSVRKRDYPFKGLGDLLSEEEVLKLIEAASSERDKCLIAMLYDTAARPSEILNLKIKDLRINESYGEVTVTGKTGFRRIPLTFSTPYVRRWLNEHPSKNDPDAPLFLKHKHGRGGDSLTVEALGILLKKLARRIGLKKRITPYILRHSRLTRLADILRESQLKAFAGWTAGSKMAEVYVRLSGLDIDAPLLEAHGLRLERKKESMLKVKKCPRCGHVNPPTAIYCESCHMVVDDKAVIAHTLEIEKRVKEELETMKKLVFENISFLIEALVFRDPDYAKLVLRRNPELLKRFIEMRDAEFLAEYARAKGLDLEAVLNKTVEEIIGDEKRLEGFIRAILLKGCDESVAQFELEEGKDHSR